MTQPSQRIGAQARAAGGLLAQQMDGRFTPGEGWNPRSWVDAWAGQWVVTPDTLP
jgi:hypothetical protein